ncbi:MAG: Orotate phosphoribosyltransferase [Candidatus Beckwithbacteria bacterium GW2011_GWA2_43_10]|uniref:Orotate phosphoribosyltransferase n=1 Tax=Candidatus Beckwithbacteria bacterium GW2011_GWA2_43_10 TaxID=1618369 RepID=A0A0G1C534_9BACT|nr:MAG: Orotate phosphoribosyltransferase [Candidatus Beckwithbacteria bacterium GW2011_GWA2_43_10]
MGKAEEIALLLLKAKAVKFNFEKPTVFASGVSSPVYIDNRLMISYPKFREVILDNLIELIQEEIGEDKVEVISGTARAALPYAAMVAQKLNKPMIYVRTREKAHGKENIIEGVIKKKQKVVIIEDHISTGGSAINNVWVLRESGARVDYCLAITSYGLKLAENLFRKHKIKLLTLTDFKTLVKVAEKFKYISELEKKTLIDWWSNPVTWAFA